MQITVGELSKLLNGEVVGDKNAVLNKVAKIDEGEPGALSFLANPKYEPYIYDTKSSAVLVNRSFSPSAEVKAILIKVDDAYAGFSYLLEKFSSNGASRKGIEKDAAVSNSARIGADVYIGSQSYVSDGAAQRQFTPFPDRDRQLPI
jgi:UDP-3-O-[3-hydroxymyristoyl] glucosamine N-acyltransferase